MRYLFVSLSALTLCGITPAKAVEGPLFGCEARAPSVCYFRIFYQRGGRIVILPAGMKNKMPDVVVGRDRYCVALGKTPAYTCTQKPINGTYNS
jgi:hypothetical protein